MAVSGKTAPHEIPYFLDSDKPPNMATVTKAIADRVEALLAKGGDVSIAADGTITIAEGAVGASEIADGTVGLAELAAVAKPVRWWTPSVVAASQSRSNTAFGVLGTPDRVSIVTAAHMMILIVADARVQCSVAGAGRVAVFIGGKQIQFDAGAGRVVQEIPIEGAATDRHVYSHPGGLAAVTGAAYGGISANQPNVMGGPLGGGAIWVWAGENATHPFGAADVEIQYRATSGSITADERRLLVGTIS